ncbi:lipopolysaccharide kinase InaA family protein [Algisphaera agarilytica]|uniref:lipopolysaccharide kinase InaA family protein n=1 Tax=Algisphaera agarilytica TaxID=1385975 RepID=UPI001C87EFA4|nr:lipopolysaccharide kinase InaA family protein [Algisphaera agarilytica]
MPEPTAELPEPAELLALPEAKVFKQDRRSRVWSVEDGSGRRWAIKRFEHSPLRQRLVAKVGQHPAQREVKWHAKLIAAELPVVPIFAAGHDASGRQWLITPWRGDDLAEWIQDGRLADDPALRHDVTRQLGAIAGRIMQMRVFNRDFKARNFVVDEQGKVWLIDAGGCRGGKGTPLLAFALRMLTLLNRTARGAAKESGRADALPSRTDRQRFFRTMTAAWPSLPDGMQHLPRSQEFD